MPGNILDQNGRQRELYLEFDEPRREFTCIDPPCYRHATVLIAYNPGVALPRIEYSECGAWWEQPSWPE
jgi:hypothetical protein